MNESDNQRLWVSRARRPSRRVFQANEGRILAAWLDVGGWDLRWQGEVTVPG